METQLEKQCDTCGAVAWHEALATCCKCRTYRHVYCMLVNVIEIPEIWTCEDCAPNKDSYDRKENFQNSSNDAVMHGVSTKNDKLGLFLKRKNAKPSKVKYIPLEEVFKLSSGAAKSGSPSKRNMSYRSGTSYVAPKFSPLRVKPNPDMAPFVTPPGPRRIDFSSMSSQQAPRVSKGRNATIHNVKDSNCKEQKNAVIKSVNEVEICNKNVPAKEVKNCYANLVGREEKACNTKDEGPVNKLLWTSSTSVDRLSINGSGFGPVELASPGVNLLIHDMCHPYFPAKDSIWKGGFKFPDTMTPGAFYGGFQAQPSSTVSARAYNFSKTMPIVLQVVLLPQNDVWADLFQNDHPNFSDIALYFFPSANIERSKKNHGNLFKLLETRNSIMKSCINDSELLIFTSKQLHPLLQDIVERLSTEQFLWGMFCKSKGEKIPLECDRASAQCSALSDMEIDMEGGQPKGRVDIVVTKESSKSVCGRSVKKAADREVTQKINSELPSEHSFQKLLKLADAEVGIAPGFGKLYQQNLEHDLNIRPLAEMCALSCWSPPPIGWIKLNLAVSLKGRNSGVAGAGGVMRDKSGKWVHGYSLNLGPQTILTTEFWALFQGLTLAWNDGFRKVLVESESLLAIEHLKKTYATVDANKVVVDCCVNLIKRDWDCKLVHINRHANLSARWLAAHFDDHPLGMTVFKSPPDSSLQQILQNDSTTVEKMEKNFRA